jgi:hypothetical protein
MKSVCTKFAQKMTARKSQQCEATADFTDLAMNAGVNLVKITCASWTSSTPWTIPWGICWFSRGAQGAQVAPWKEVGNRKSE